MHWFWRAVITFVVVIGFEVWYFAYGWNALWNLAYQSFQRWDLLNWKWVTNVCAVFAGLPILLVALLTYGILRYLFTRRVIADGETRCRKCEYILRGITEPRCPECGERI